MARDHGDTKKFYRDGRSHGIDGDDGRVGVFAGRGEHRVWAGRFQGEYGGAVVDLLVEHGADLNAVNSSGETVLDRALDGDSRELAGVLRERGGQRSR